MTIEIAGMSIKTVRERLNFTVCRDFDWSAVNDATYDGEGCPIGWGATEAAAVVDLILDSGEWPDRGDRDAAWEYRLRAVQEWPL